MKLTKVFKFEYNDNINNIAIWKKRGNYIDICYKHDTSI